MRFLWDFDTYRAGCHPCCRITKAHLVAWEPVTVLDTGVNSVAIDKVVLCIPVYATLHPSKEHHSGDWTTQRSK